MHTTEELSRVLRAMGVRTEEQVSLSAHTTFRIGGPADLGVFPSSAEQLAAAVRVCRDAGVPYTVLGNGSDILASDAGYRGCVIFTSCMKRISIEGTCLSAEAGVLLSSAAVSAREASLAGLSFAYGIPGSIGGAVFMNAGAYGGEMADIVEQVTVLDTETDEIRTLSGEACAFAYRDSVFQHQSYVILSAVLSLSPGQKAQIRAEMEDYLARRKAKQPLEYPSAGSTFKRCPGYYTAQLIDEAGLKGYAVGGAQVSEKHAGFIINRGNATAADVRALVAYIKQRILESRGLSIVCEIRPLGPDGKE